MISLKKYLDMTPDHTRTGDAGLNDLFSALLESYRSAVLSMGNSGVRACPASGCEFQHALAKLERQLFGNLTVPLVRQVETDVEVQLQQWGESTSEYFQVKANEVKELLIVLAHAAESLGERDQRYAIHFGELTAQLHTIADLEDLAEVRSSLVKHASQLKTYVDKMAQEGRQSVAQLKAEVSTYETKLKAAEQLAMQDTLTGILNRRGSEAQIEWRIEHQKAFCVVIIDLNRFKCVNDTHGHAAGDCLLKQFSQELRSNIRSSDVVGRWGGDEFILVLDGDIDTAQSQIERLQKWVVGEYTVQLDKASKALKFDVKASLGLAQWVGGESMKQLIARADSAMYKQKQQARGQNA
ncbi:MAG: GGDEF domain-containing protein [Candidatus Sulfotelmatobacter sp.]